MSTYQVELWVITPYTSEYGGTMEVEAPNAAKAVELPSLREWAAAGDYGDETSVRVRFQVRGKGSVIIAKSVIETLALS